MGRIPITQRRRKQEESAEKAARLTRAIADYQRKNSAIFSESKPVSIEKIAMAHHVSKTTLWRQLNGGVSIRDFNAAKRHFTEAETKVFLAWIIEQGQRGFPATHRIVEERANAILQVWKGPEFCVGKMWLSRFLDTHKGVLSQYWAKPLDRTRASGLNPVAVDWYFQALERVAAQHTIPQENWYGADETGLALGLAGKTRVIAGAGKSVQHKLQDGEREIVTVLETICADGTCLKPTVIFKGKNLLKKWGLENPCNAA